MSIPNNLTDDSSSLPTSPSPKRFDLPRFTSYADEMNSTRSNSPEPESKTPTLTESYGTFRRNLSFKSLKDLELKEVQSALWRNGEKESGNGKKKGAKPTNHDQLFGHAFRGACRSLVLAASLRAGVNLIVVALRASKKRGIPSKLIMQALFGEDTIRFGAMLGIFTFLYKYVLHALRIYNPGKKGFGHEEVWHAGLAGAISALSVLAEKKSRRVTLGQQMLVRGLQGNYNIAKRHGYINIPNGDVLLFGLASGQIMYSWLMAPEALPPGYLRWVTTASRVAEPCLPVNLSAYRTNTFDPAIARSAITWKSGATPRNASIIEEYARKAENGDFGECFAPCAVVHPFMDSCVTTFFDRWQSVFRFMLPVYGALHFVPPILLRRKLFLHDPQKVLTKSLIGTFRSSSFLAAFVSVFQSLVCSQRNVYYAIHGRVPKWVEDILLHKGYYWVAGFVASLSLFIEEKKRRRELAMYVLPRGLESLWSVLRRRSYVPFVPGGEVILTSLGLSMVMSTYQHDPKSLSGLVRSVLFQFIGHG